MNPTYTQLATELLKVMSWLLMMTIVLLNLKRLIIDVASEIESRRYHSAIRILHRTLRFDIILSPFIILALVFALSLP